MTSCRPPRSHLTLLATALTGLLAAALAPTAPAGVDDAVELLREAAAADDPAVARELAGRALPELEAAASADDAPCVVLMRLGEGQLRAGRPAEALRTADRARSRGCAPPDWLQLRAWALEHAPDGTRRGPGAPLQEAEATYVRVATLLAGRPAPDAPRIAGALAHAAELARLRGDPESAWQRAAQALSLRPGADQAESLAATALGACATLRGEGHCLDEVGQLLARDSLERVIDRRIRSLRLQLEASLDPSGFHDVEALTGLAFYALMAGGEAELYNARRYLERASEIDAKHPELWYLLGRVRQEDGELEAAKEAYRFQRHFRPDAPATRLAVNALAWLEVTAATSRARQAEALRMLDEQLARTPDEAAMDDTRARLLVALERREEGCAAGRRALELAADERLRQGIGLFLREQGCF